MSIEDELYYEQNPEALEQTYRDYLAEHGPDEADFTLADFRNEM